MAQDRQFVALRVVASVPGPISLPFGGVAFDALLAAQIAREQGLPPCVTLADWQPIEIPIALSECGRFHLCSVAHPEVAEREVRHINKRAPIEEYGRFGVRGTINITAGQDKAYRLPLEVVHLRDGQLEWWCLGDEQEIRRLCNGITALGRKRSNGFGAVEEWSVEPCGAWPGFPVLRDGSALRPLPLDYPGLAPGYRAAHKVLGLPVGPSWAHERAELCACP
jgi:hypothetical protein